MSDRAIIEAVTKMTGLHKVDQVAYVNATIESVDEKNRTCVCVVVDGHTEYKLTARLMPTIDDGFLIIPSKDSTVKIIFSERIEASVIQFSEIDKIIIVSNVLTQFNDGTFGGVVKVKDLVSKLNSLESDLNKIKNIFSIWMPVSGDGGAALKTAATEWSSNPITKTKVFDLENKLVTHGK